MQVADNLSICQLRFACLAETTNTHTHIQVLHLLLSSNIYNRFTFSCESHRYTIFTSFAQKPKAKLIQEAKKI